jgi:hypothetical protein
MNGQDHRSFVEKRSVKLLKPIALKQSTSSEPIELERDLNTVVARLQFLWLIFSSELLFLYLNRFKEIDR